MSRAKPRNHLIAALQADLVGPFSGVETILDKRGGLIASSAIVLV